ncbi:DNA damage-binding protein 2 [Ixodes scapularis]|uniref:DNA damage-binding protein 2 n=1 Tax=Ixodes scapularis TaxID=6945 RepID=UPI001A9E95F2|nr:DNA damage-binding protein 2 [Ixodes scapularis]
MAPRRKAAPKPDAVDQGRRRSSRTAGRGIANDPAPAAPAAKIKDLKKANAVARKKDTAESNAVTPGLPVRPTNLIQYLDGFMRRDKSTKQLLAEFKRQLLADNILKFEVKPPTAGLQFQQLARITCIEWHPSQPELCAFGSKTGEIVLWNSSAPDKRTGTPPMGNGGSVAAMKFLKGDAQRMYTATLLGRVMLQDFGGAQPQVFSDTNSHEVWFTALDVCYQQKLILAGDNVGKVYAFSPEGKVLWPNPVRLHKSKVKHIEFSKKDPNLVLTASVDHTVKLWDARRLTGQKDFLFSLEHKHGVNSGYFSRVDGNSILTTDQNSELRVYRGPLWQDVTIIRQPHRQFQHLTAMQATWHPSEDFVVVGRYPDPKFKEKDLRGIDLFDGHAGVMLGKIRSSLALSGIYCLNSFNCSGEILASGMGTQAVIFGAALEE